MRTASRTRRAGAGFTLLELVFVIVVLAALTKFAMAKLVTPGSMTLPAQAQSLADLIRRAQSLAMVRGQRMSVAVPSSGANRQLAIACASGATPCNTDTTLTVSQGVAVVSAGTIYFNTLGQPVDGAGTPLAADTRYQLCYQTGSTIETYTVSVAALTGRVMAAVCRSPAVCPLSCP